MCKNKFSSAIKITQFSAQRNSSQKKKISKIEKKELENFRNII